ncbi:MAG: hypothetical protein GEV05_17775 [Betaproteobacteria bacterium]|nr:hypothetical protein [Betaproteobacteria bacterium]
MLIVTHHMKFARSSDRVLFFDAGVIVEDATPQTIFESPRDERVRRFVAAVSEVEEGAWAR